MLPGLHVVEALQQRKQRGLAAAGMANQPDPLAGPEADAEILENPPPVGIAEIDVLEFHAGAAADQRLRLGMVAQIVRHQKRRDGLGKPRDVLGDVDQRHREVARRAQHRERERAGEHDVAGRRLALASTA